MRLLQAFSSHHKQVLSVSRIKNPIRWMLLRASASPVTDSCVSSTRNYQTVSNEPPTSSLAARLFGSRPPANLKRQKVVVLGSGWASFFFLRSLDFSKYEVWVISPRNFFTFTPLLPSACTGILAPTSCVEPIRRLLSKKQKNVKGIKHRSLGEPANFLAAECIDVDFTKKAVLCRQTSSESREGHLDDAVLEGGNKQNKNLNLISMNYDYLVMGIGSTSNTFGIKGVSEYAYFLKEVSQALDIKKKVNACFEAASFMEPLEERRRLLHFVVVGGGPTGVEVAGELADLIKYDMESQYPGLASLAKVTLIEMTSKLLPMFPQEISKYTRDSLKTISVDVRIDHAVVEIGEKSLKMKSLAKESKEKSAELIDVPYGFVLWASGVGQQALAEKIITKLPEQTGNRVMNVNPQFRVFGAEDVFAFGDCSWMKPPSLEDNATALYQSTGPGGITQEWINRKRKELIPLFPQLSPIKIPDSKFPLRENMDFESFKTALASMDKMYKPPAPTAQNASRAGTYLADVFNKKVTSESKKNADGFIETWSGALAYIGGHRAVIASPYMNLLGGPFSSLAWKMVYLQMQTSWSSRVSCCFDWLRAGVFGRSLSQ